MSTTPCRLAVLISGRGSNMQAIVQALHGQDAARVTVVIANRANAAGLEWAHAQGIATRVVAHDQFDRREAFDQALGDALDEFAPDYVLLAGFMRILTPGFVQRFHGRLINIHPSLLPAFPGLDTHRKALEAGVRWHGCTVHFVTPVLDHGPVIIQGVVPVRDDDDPDTLANRVLEVEHVVYPRVAEWLGRGQVGLGADGRVTAAPGLNRTVLWTPQGVRAADV